MSQPMTPAEFDATLTRGSAVEAHWTSTGHRYVAPATVIKVNAKSVLVRLDADVHSMAGLVVVYRAYATHSLPRYASNGYSANNGAYPVAGDTAVPVADSILVEAYPSEYDVETVDEARQALLADHATIQEMLVDAEAQPQVGGDATEWALLRAPVVEWEIAPVPVSAWWGSGSPGDAAQPNEAPAPLALDLEDAQGTLGEETQAKDTRWTITAVNEAGSPTGASTPITDPATVAVLEAWAGGLEDEGEPVRLVPRIWLYTTAPADLDLAETVTVEEVGVLHPNPAMARKGQCPLSYRKVQLPARQERAQASAYGSGGWNVHTPSQFAELLDEKWFCERFIPKECE